MVRPCSGPSSEQCLAFRSVMIRTREQQIELARAKLRPATDQLYAGSAQISDTDAVGSIGNRNLDVFAIAKITTKNACAVPPTHLVTRTPNLTQPSLQRRRTPTAPLTRLTRRACW